jgi:DinB superfamily
MQYLKLSAADRAQLMDSLAAMPAYLRQQFTALSAREACLPGPDGAFSPLEQVWHLCDLEREGFGERIRRLRDETAPHLPDFDGARIAQQRGYRELSLSAGLDAFAAARAANLVALRALPVESWTREGFQEGVGTVSLCDMPAFLLQHDQAHRLEIEQWQQRRHPSAGG